MKPLAILIVLSLSQIKTFAQIDSATYYHDILEHNRSKDILIKRLKQNKYKDDYLKGLDTYNLACGYALLGNAKKSIETLQKARAMDSSYFKLIVTDRDFYNILHTDEWRKFMINFKKENKIIMSDSLFLDLTDIAIRDQAFYTEIDFYEKKSGIKSAKVLQYWKLKDSLNKVNLNLVNTYISSGVNVLSDSIVGWKLAKKCFLVIQHSDINTMEKFLPIIKNLVDRKHADGESYAMLYDRVSVNKNKGIQYYGTQVNPETNQPFLIKDEKNVDKRRAELGMINIKEYLLMMNIVYDPKRKK